MHICDRSEFESSSYMFYINVVIHIDLNVSDVYQDLLSSINIMNTYITIV